MTIVAVWYEPADQMIWAVGDTRISGRQLDAPPLTDSGAKIFPLSIACRQPGPAGFFDHVTFNTTWGFAYAGSSLYALMSYAVANACLENLIHAPGAPPPSIEEAVGMFQRIAQLYAREAGGTFSAAIFGWCTRSERFVAFEVSQEPRGGCRDMRLIEHRLRDENDVLLLGNEPEQIRADIEAELERCADQPLKRAPKTVIGSLVRENRLPGIGGGLQLGGATRYGFQLMSTVQVYEGRAPAAFSSLLGLNIDDDIGPVGHCRIGMTGMA